MIGGNLKIGDELRADAKKPINKAEIGPERFKLYVKILENKGFFGQLKGNRFVLNQSMVNEYLRSHIGLIDRLDDVEVELQKDQIDFKLKVKLLKSSTPTEVSASVKLKRYEFGLQKRILEFELIQSKDIITNEVVANLIAAIIIQVVQTIINTKLDTSKVFENRDFIDTKGNLLRFDLNKSPYLRSIFGIKVEDVSVFDFIRVSKLEVLPGELIVYPDLSIFS